MNVLVAIYSAFRNWTIPDAHVQVLRAAFPQHRFVHARDDRAALDGIVDAEVAFAATVTRDQLAAARRLRWMHNPAAGVGHMLSPELVAHPALLTNGRGTSADTIAEHAVAVVLALFRRLPLAFARQAQRVWAQDEIASPPGNRTIAGSRVLIVGLGAIGAATAARFAALGATVTGVRRRDGGDPVLGVAAVHSRERLLDLLPQADVVIVSAPHTPDTRALIGERELAAMSKTAVLVNVSRGALVDEDALAAALRGGRIAGAALDVLRDEPLEPGHPVWDVPNLLITPHVSGFRVDHWDAVVRLFSDNLRRFEAGQPLVNVVDKHAGY